MLPDRNVKLVVFGALLVHGLGHAGALGAQIWIQYSPNTDMGGWLGARSWVVPALPLSAGTIAAGAFWIVSLIGFVLSALRFWGTLHRPASWRRLAVVSAGVSATGIVLFFGTWPMWTTAAALGMNVVAVILSRTWPP